MKRKRAEALRQEWGDKPCDHPEFAREYDLGERTGGGARATPHGEGEGGGDSEVKFFHASKHIET